MIASCYSLRHFSASCLNFVTWSLKQYTCHYFPILLTSEYLCNQHSIIWMMQRGIQEKNRWHATSAGFEPHWIQWVRGERLTAPWPTSSDRHCSNHRRTADSAGHASLPAPKSLTRGHESTTSQVRVSGTERDTSSTSNNWIQPSPDADSFVFCLGIKRNLKCSLTRKRPCTQLVCKSNEDSERLRIQSIQSKPCLWQTCSSTSNIHSEIT